MQYEDMDHCESMLLYRLLFSDSCLFSMLTTSALPTPLTPWCIQRTTLCSGWMYSSFKAKMLIRRWLSWTTAALLPLAHWLGSSDCSTLLMLWGTGRVTHCIGHKWVLRECQWIVIICSMLSALGWEFFCCVGSKSHLASLYLCSGWLLLSPHC